jgi:hypothetical protein
MYQFLSSNKNKKKKNVGGTITLLVEKYNNVVEGIKGK